MGNWPVEGTKVKGSMKRVQGVIWLPPSWSEGFPSISAIARLDIHVIQQRLDIQRLYVADPAWLWDSLFLRHELEKDWERLYVYLCDFGILNTWLPMPQLKFREHLQIPHQYIYGKQKNVLSLKSSFRSIVFLSRSFSFFLHCRSSILVKMAAATQMVEYFILDTWHSICVELVKFFSCLRLHLWHNKSSVLKFAVLNNEAPFLSWSNFEFHFYCPWTNTDRRTLTLYTHRCKFAMHPVFKLNQYHF